MALCCLAIMPFFMIAAALTVKADNKNLMNVQELEGSDEGTDEQKESQILCSDSIQNYKTVASFGNDDIILKQFGDLATKGA